MRYKEFILKHYKNRSIYDRRKAEYSIGFLLILLGIVLVLNIVKLAFEPISPIEHIINIVVVAVFTAVFFILYKGKLHVGITILTMLGIARAVNVYFLYGPVNFYIFVPLIVIGVAVLHTHVFQYLLTNFFVIIIAVMNIILQFNKFEVGEITYIEFSSSFIFLLYIIGILFVMKMLSKVVDDEIEKSTKLDEIASKDYMTNAYNRRKIDQIPGKSKLEIDTSVLMVDFDHFKSINDTFGHDIGDKILIESIDLIKRLIRSNDTIIRWGGEEFVILLSNCNIEEAYTVGEKIRGKIAVHNYNVKHDISMTVSIGVASLTKDENIYETINRADQAMYVAKDKGRNRVVKIQ